MCSDEDVAAALENDLPRAHILVSEMTPMEGYRLAEIQADGPRTSEAFTTDFSFVNLIEHKAEEIIGFYGDREHKGRCQSLAGKRRLNGVFKAMGLCYADRSSPSTSLPADNAAPRGHGRGARGQRRRVWKATAGRGTKTVAMESRKRKLGGRGRFFAEPVDVRIGREITGKVGNNKRS